MVKKRLGYALCACTLLGLLVACVPIGRSTPVAAQRRPFRLDSAGGEGADLSWHGYADGYRPGTTETMAVALQNNTGQPWNGRLCLQLLQPQPSALVIRLAEQGFALEAGGGFTWNAGMELPADLPAGSYGLSLVIHKPAGPLVEVIPVQLGGDEQEPFRGEWPTEAALAACPAHQGAGDVQPAATPTAAAQAQSSQASAATPTTEPAVPSPQPPEEELAVTVYLGNTQLNPGLVDCRLVHPVTRLVPVPAADGAHRALALAEAALGELFAGPTPAELEQGYVSIFSAQSAAGLKGLSVQGQTAYVNLADMRHVLSAAGTSCGSQAFLAAVDSTVQAVLPVERVVYAINGDPAAFYEWIQVGCSAANDFCDPAPFAPQ